MTPLLQKVIFAGTSGLTQYFPRSGSRLLNFAAFNTIGSPLLAQAFHRRNCHTLKRVKAFRRFLVIPDCHIGDSIMFQAVLPVIRECFPEAEIDYVVNKVAAPLIFGNPDAHQILPLFSGGNLPCRGEMDALRKVAREGNYDLCFNFSPFLGEKDFPPRLGVVNFVTHGTLT